MDCRDCARYRTEPEDRGVCADRKLNPDSWEDAVSVGQLYGLRAVCLFNDHRERLIAATLGTPAPTLARGAARVGRPSRDRWDLDR